MKCLEEGDGDGKESGRPACVVGAGGASRAAVWALGVEMACQRIYVVSREVGKWMH